ncbi:MAG: hypothetical protein U0835_20090 [Isosphaeraceae bacterium]
MSSHLIRTRPRGMVQIELVVFLPLVVLGAALMMWFFKLQMARISVAVDARNTAWAVRLRKPLPPARLLPRDEFGEIRRRAWEPRDAWWTYESSTRQPTPDRALAAFGLHPYDLRVRYALRDGGPIPGVAPVDPPPENSPPAQGGDPPGVIPPDEDDEPGDGSASP